MRQETIKPLVQSHVEPGSTIYTDEYDTYDFLSASGYTHETANHSKGEYARGDVHVNTIEGLWSIVRPWIRVYRGVTKRYLPLYVSAIEFLLNLRGLKVMDRIKALLGKCLLPTGRFLRMAIQFGTLCTICA